MRPSTGPRRAAAIAAAGLMTAELLVTAQPASAAAVTVGQTFTPTVAACALGNAPSVEEFQTARVDSTSYVVPTDGVLSSWSFQTGTVGANLTLRVFRPVGAQFRVVADASALKVLPGDSRLHTFSARIPVRAGDLIGFRTAPLPNGGGAGVCWAPGTVADQSMIKQASDPTPIGTTASYTQALGHKVDISARLESDADRDGFGDDSQDPCPTVAGPAGSPCPLPPRPDGLIKKRSGSYVGNGVYNTTGAGQTVTAKKRRTKKATFFIAVQDDGPSRDSFTVSGAGRKSGFRVRYFAGTTDITSAVVAGTYRIRNLAPGQLRVVTLVIKVKATARKGILRSWPVISKSVKDTTRRDVVRANVRVRTG